MQTAGRTGGQTDGRTDGQIDGRMGGESEGWREREMGEWWDRILSPFRTREKGTMVVLYRTFILCRLSHCSQLWSPDSIKLTVEFGATQQIHKEVCLIATTQLLGKPELIKSLLSGANQTGYAVIYIRIILEIIA